MSKFSITSLLFLLCAFAFFVYSGLFAEAEITEDELGPFWVIYETYQGSYADASTVLKYVEGSIFMEKAVKSSRSFGLFFDRPSVLEAKRRSAVGVIIDNPTPELINYLSARYKVARLPRAKSVITTFPYKNAFSLFIGNIKVYPKLGHYLAKHHPENKPILEIYDHKNKLIIYSVPFSVDLSVYQAIYNKHR